MPLTRIQSLGITDGTIVNADINASAAIAGTKLSGAGKVLQVVTTTLSTNLSVSAGSTPVELTGLTRTITPSSASSKILILWKINQANNNGNANIDLVKTISATSSNIGMGNSSQGGDPATISICTANMNNYWSFEVGGSFLDSPATTSQITYSFKVHSNDGTYTFHFNRTARNGGSDGNVISTLTLLEIGA